ncbi:MAG: hypothetical protein CNB76_00375 [Puniceicoccaceae bacterium MED-G32]|nr:MAG: hypothetical protein CNB76_00375 [Puniceicoccaceae bacterium MED-G32]
MLETRFNGQDESQAQINFDSLSTNYGANTISVGPAPAGHPLAPQGSPGMITTTDPESTPPSIVIHTLVFKGNTPLEFLRLNTILNSGWTDGSLVLNEVTGIVSAEIVPEPSTYALLAGIVAFAFIAKRKRTKA